MNLYLSQKPWMTSGLICPILWTLKTVVRFFLSMFTLRSVLDRRKAVQEKKIHRVLYTWLLGLIEYYMCCLRFLRCVWCEGRRGGIVVGRRHVVGAAMGGGWWGEPRGHVMRAGP